MNNTKQSRTKSATKQGKRQASQHVVHFEFDDPSAHEVCLAGTFNGWKAERSQMTRQGNGKWAKDLNLEPGTYEYRLVVDGHWQPDPTADHTVMNPFGERNSLLVVSG